MKTTEYGQAVLNTTDVFNGLYSGKIVDLGNIFLDDPTEVKKFHDSVKKNFDDFNSPKEFYKSDIMSVAEFDQANQMRWFMPEDCVHENLVEMLYGMCKTDEQVERVSQELELFIQHGMMDLLFYLKYLVDTMRTHNVVWGVGRGSSVASYVLYLIGVHRIDSIKYKLDIHEFLK
jgi:DNA polymerase III alpha subunit